MDKADGHIRYAMVGEVSPLAARLMAASLEEKSDNTDGAVIIDDYKVDGCLQTVIASDSKEEIIEAIANLMYSHDISLEEIASELTAKNLLGAPKSSNRYMLLPMELTE